MIGDDFGWEHTQEVEPDPAGEVEQLRLLEPEEPEWKLDLRTRQVGQAGVRLTTETWKRGKRP